MYVGSCTWVENYETLAKLCYKNCITICSLKFLGFVMTLYSVSYTHLDVYKRQTVYLPILSMIHNNFGMYQPIFIKYGMRVHTFNLNSPIVF